MKITQKLISCLLEIKNLLKMFKFPMPVTETKSDLIYMNGVWMSGEKNYLMIHGRKIMACSNNCQDCPSDFNPSGDCVECSLINIQGALPLF